MLFLGRIQNSLEGILLKVDLIYYIRPKLVEPQLSQSLPAPPPPPRTFWLGRALQNFYFLLLFLDSHNLHRSQVSTNLACLAS